MAELIQAEDNTLWSEIHKLINSIWIKEELPKSGRNPFCTSSNLSNILVSRLTPYVDKIIILYLSDTGVKM
jgi:hypothetical protein